MTGHVSTCHLAFTAQAKLWPSLKPLFTAKEIPIEAGNAVGRGDMSVSEALEKPKTRIDKYL